MPTKLTVVLISLALLTGCSYVPAGHVGVKLYLLGGSKGVDTEELSPGRYWIGWNEQLFIFPTFTQTDRWENKPNKDESVKFQTIEGLTVSADIGATFSVDKTKVSTLFEKYRRGIDEISDIYLRNIIVNTLVKHAGAQPVDYVYGRGKVELMARVLQAVRDQVAPFGIILEDVYWLGDIRLPPEVLKALNEKIQATQKAQQRENEVAQAKAEADKEREKAKGEADAIWYKAEAQAKANAAVAASVTPNLIEYEKVKKWDGVQPRIQAGNSGMMLSIPSGQTK